MSLRHLLRSISSLHGLTSASAPALTLPAPATWACVTSTPSLRHLSSWTAHTRVASSFMLSRLCAQDSIQCSLARHMSKLVPKFTGGKLRPFTSFKERFKITGSGLIVFKRPGHRHKRFSKSPKRNRQFRRTAVLTNAYTTTMKRLGFVSRSY